MRALPALSLAGRCRHTFRRRLKIVDVGHPAELSGRVTGAVGASELGTSRGALLLRVSARAPAVVPGPFYVLRLDAATQ